MDRVPDEFRSHLSHEEYVLWHGRPKQGLCLRASDAMFIPFTMLCAAIAWGNFFEDAASPLVWLPVVPMAFACTYMILGRFIIDRIARARTFYAVTQRRVLIVNGVTHRTISSLLLHSLAAMTYAQRRDGSGTVTLGRAPLFYDLMRLQYALFSPGECVPQLEGIDNAHDVFKLIRKAQRGELREFDRHEGGPLIYTKTLSD